MGTTVSGPSITVDETAETITLTAGATIPASFLRVFGCETMTVTGEAEVTRKIKALDVVPAIGMSGSMRRGTGEDGTGKSIRFGDSADCIRTRPPGGALQYANHWFSVHTPSEPRNPTDVRFGSLADIQRHTHLGPL